MTYDQWRQSVKAYLHSAGLTDDEILDAVQLGELRWRPAYAAGIEPMNFGLIVANRWKYLSLVPEAKWAEFELRIAS